MLDPEEAINRLRAAFRGPDGFRTLHAKGGFYTGTFTATPRPPSCAGPATSTGSRTT